MMTTTLIDRWVINITSGVYIFENMVYKDIGKVVITSDSNNVIFSFYDTRVPVISYYQIPKFLVDVDGNQKLIGFTPKTYFNKSVVVYADIPRQERRVPASLVADKISQGFDPFVTQWSYKSSYKVNDVSDFGLLRMNIERAIGLFNIKIENKISENDKFLNFKKSMI